MIIFKTLSFLVGIASGLSALVASYLAYFFKTTELSTGRYFDGFGRELTLTPTIIRVIFDADSLWAGPLWSIIDWISIIILMTLAYFSLRWVFTSEK